MPTLRLLTSGAKEGRHKGEVFACAYAPDSAFVLSGGWDGHLRLWEATTGNAVTGFPVSPKPIAACAVAPDGKQWLSGSLDGLLAYWDPLTHARISVSAPHARPLSSIVFAPDGRTLATASWDSKLLLWDLSRQREARPLLGHEDIVAGCRFTPSAQQLLSWSYDNTVRLWDVARGKLAATLPGHSDRVTAGAVSPDGRWAASGGRDGTLKLWDLTTAREQSAGVVGAEVRGCVFLLDGQSLVSVDALGRLALHTVPSLEDQSELATLLPVQCAELAPSGSQMALGCDDGLVRLVAVDDFDSSPLFATATESVRYTATPLQRLLGKRQANHVYHTHCPVCRERVELPGKPEQHLPCPHCRRALRVSALIPDPHE